MCYFNVYKYIIYYFLFNIEINLRNNDFIRHFHNDS